MKNKSIIISIFAGMTFLMVAFQNCASDVEFSTSKDTASTGVVGAGEPETPVDPPVGPPVDPPIEPPVDPPIEPPVTPPVDPPVVVCNPFDPTEPCFEGSDAGLMGKIYYLTDIHKPLFSGSLYNARVDDYKTFGNEVPVDIIMGTINISPRAWDTGFYIGADIISNESGDALFEWFSLDLSGEITLPAGTYQFGQLADDGMRVTVDGSVIIEDDGLHSPRWKCASNFVTFADNEKKSIRIQYFQGPRTNIAMQLFVRTSDQSSDSCNTSGGMLEIDAAAYSH